MNVNLKSKELINLFQNNGILTPSIAQKRANNITIDLTGDVTPELLEDIKAIAYEFPNLLRHITVRNNTDKPIDMSSLLKGIGDTIRVSITDDPVKEIYAAKDILKAVNIRVETPQIVSCPTCGRTKIDLVSLANQVENAVRDIKKPIKIAVMGCVVNGPGEAKEADIGIAGGDGCAVLFKKGEILRKVSEENVLKELLEEIDKI